MSSPPPLAGAEPLRHAMLGRHAAPVPGERMVIRALFLVAPIADDTEIAVVVGTAVLQCESVIDIPIVSGPEPA